MRLIDADALVIWFRSALLRAKDFADEPMLPIESVIAYIEDEEVAPTISPGGDLISRADAIEYLVDNMILYSDDGYEEPEEDKAEYIKELVNDIPSADRPRWIPVSEPYEENCDTFKHQSESWDSETCDGCCGNHSNYERR